MLAVRRPIFWLKYIWVILIIIMIYISVSLIGLYTLYGKLHILLKQNRRSLGKLPERWKKGKESQPHIPRRYTMKIWPKSTLSCIHCFGLFLSLRFFWNVAFINDAIHIQECLEDSSQFPSISHLLQDLQYHQSDRCFHAFLSCGFVVPETFLC